MWQSYSVLTSPGFVGMRSSRSSCNKGNRRIPPRNPATTPHTTSGRKGTTLEEDQSELELTAEIWCRLGKERLKRASSRVAEECCGYVTELLPQSAAARRRVHPRLWRWLAVAEGLWGQAVASMVAPESQEKPLQDELRCTPLREPRKRPELIFYPHFKEHPN